uniref:Uncharacterized protein n=1 Tax=Rhizophora mucronata TaxID=61149 RepID=A0A2P2N9Y1_RHIMU
MLFMCLCNFLFLILVVLKFDCCLSCTSCFFFGFHSSKNFFWKTFCHLFL